MQLLFRPVMTTEGILVSGLNSSTNEGDWNATTSRGPLASDFNNSSNEKNSTSVLDLNQEASEFWMYKVSGLKLVKESGNPFL